MRTSCSTRAGLDEAIALLLDALGRSKTDREDVYGIHGSRQQLRAAIIWLLVRRDRYVVLSPGAG